MTYQATLLIAGLLCAGAAFAQPAAPAEPAVATQVISGPVVHPPAAPAGPRYALVEAPTLPCAPAYCPQRALRAPRADRH